MRKTRLGAFRAKIAKAKTIRGDKASKYKLFSTGAMPTLTYGHQVAGWTPVILRTVRVKAAKALGIWSASCDLDLIWQLRPKEDPLSVVAGVFPFTAWSGGTAPRPALCSQPCFLHRFLLQRPVLPGRR